MLLAFPTGSQPQDPDHPCGAIYFMGDLSWRVLIDEQVDDDITEKITEAIEYFSFVLKRHDFIEEFQRFKKEDKNDSIDIWRRKNIKLVIDKKD